MLFFFKEKPIEIVAMCRPGARFAYEYSPVKPAREIFPQWWRDTDTGKFDWDRFSAVNTTKSCVGIINQISSGLIIPAWSDLAVQWSNEAYRYSFSDKQSILELHGRDESPGFLSEFNIFKINSPWVIKSKVNLQYQFPFYHHPSPPAYTIAPGIITPQKNFCGTNIFACVKKSKDTQSLMIKNNTPLLHITPLTEKKVVYRVEIMSEEDEARATHTIACSNHFVNKGLKNIHYENQHKK